MTGARGFAAVSTCRTRFRLLAAQVKTLESTVRGVGRPRHNTIATCVATLLSLLLSPLATYCAAQSDSKPRVTIEAAGSEFGAWLIRSASRGYSTDGVGPVGETPLNIFAWQRLGGPRLEAAWVTPEIGRIVQWAASGPDLFVFFDDGTHRSYVVDDRRIEIDLPERAVPEAVAGMVGERARPRVGLYAIVQHEIGRQVLRREKEAATRPAATASPARTAPATAPSPADRAAPASRARPDEPRAAETPSAPPLQIGAAETEPVDRGFDLVSYEGARWHYVAPVTGLPEDFKPNKLWMGASSQAVFLFWPADDGVTVLRCLCWRDGRWTVLPDIELGAPLAYGTAMYLAPRIGFAAGLRGPRPRTNPQAAASDARENADEPKATAAPRTGDSGSSTTPTAATWRVWSLVDDQWRPGEPFVFDSTQAAGPDATPGRTALAALGQNVFVAVLGTGGQIDVGIWPSEGGPAKRPLAATKVFELPRRPLLDPRTRDWLGLAVVLGVLVLVFWTRQESLSTPAVLPRGLMLAAYWKRLVGMVIDLLPSVILTAGLWYVPATAYLEELATASAGWKDTVPPMPGGLLWGWLLTRVLYAGYSSLFEWMWGATPGKRLLGCHVLSEVGRPPTLREILIRNGMRIAELEPYLPIWPLLLVLFFTRNRQRLGDLLARTVVVEPGQPASETGPDDDGF